MLRSHMGKSGGFKCHIQFERNSQDVYRAKMNYYVICQLFAPVINPVIMRVQVSYIVSCPL
jgi:hypothetical protein